MLYFAKKVFCWNCSDTKSVFNIPGASDGCVVVVVLDAVVQLLHVEHLEEGEVLEEAGNHARHEGFQ